MGGEEVFSINCSMIKTAVHTYMGAYFIKQREYCQISFVF